MKIFKIDNINFDSKKSAVRKVKSSSRVDDKEIYSDINDFMTKKCDKLEYLNRFSRQFEYPKYGNIYTQAEKKYINDLLLTLDLSSDWRDIPDKHLETAIQELMKSR